MSSRDGICSQHSDRRAVGNQSSLFFFLRIRDRVTAHWVSPQMAALAGVGQAKARSLGLRVSPRSGRDPQGHCLLLSHVHYRALHRECSSNVGFQRREPRCPVGAVARPLQGCACQRVQEQEAGVWTELKAGPRRCGVEHGPLTGTLAARTNAGRLLSLLLLPNHLGAEADGAAGACARASVLLCSKGFCQTGTCLHKT